MIYQAGPVNLLRTILIIVGIYYIFKFVGRVVLPYFIKNKVDKMQREFQERQQNNSNPNNVIYKNEDITVEKPKDSGKKRNGDGFDNEEYTDFEELD